ncbi:MAG: DUF3800 domain-containing protein, partial [Burkholderiales bacterium]
IDEQAFEQVVSRFEKYIANLPAPTEGQSYGILIHDKNETVALKHTRLMRSFHDTGTLWTSISHLVDTPFFVDSSLTRMVQMADVCAYVLRRYCENQETELFDIIFSRADRANGRAVGVRHYTNSSCACQICVHH